MQRLSIRSVAAVHDRHLTGLRRHRVVEGGDCRRLRVASERGAHLAIRSETLTAAGLIRASPPSGSSPNARSELAVGACQSRRCRHARRRNRIRIVWRPRRNPPLFFSRRRPCFSGPFRQLGQRDNDCIPLGDQSSMMRQVSKACQTARASAARRRGKPVSIYLPRLCSVCCSHARPLAWQQPALAPQRL
jgi:hypothetical protein